MMDPLTTIINMISGNKMFKSCPTNVPISAPINLPPRAPPILRNKMNIAPNFDFRRIYDDKDIIRDKIKRLAGHDFNISMNGNEVCISLHGSTGCDFEIWFSGELIPKLEIRNVCYNRLHTHHLINLVDNVSVLILKNWDLSNVISLDKWFHYNNCKEIHIDKLDTGDNESIISFENCSDLKTIEFTYCHCHRIKNINFKNCAKLKHINLSCNVFLYMNSLESAFEGCFKLRTIDFTGTLFKNVTNISHCFDNCGELTTIDYSKLKFDRLFKLSYAFCKCYYIKVADFTDWNICSFDGAYFLYKCTHLRDVRFNPREIIPIVNASYCFAECSELTYLDLTMWEISTLNADLSHAFEQCSDLEELLIPLLDPFFEPNINRWLYGCYKLSSIVCTYDMYKYMCVSNGFPDHTVWKYDFNEMRAIKINEICIDRYERINHYVYRDEK